MPSTYEAVTDGQLGHIRTRARQKGVNRAMFQDGLDDGLFDRAIDAIQTGRRIVLVDEPMPLAGFAVGIPALPRPTLAEVQATRMVIRPVIDHATEVLVTDQVVDTSPTSPVVLRLGSLLLEDRRYHLSREELVRRLRHCKPDRFAGLQHGLWLYENQGVVAIPSIGRVHFFGTHALMTDNHWYYPVLKRNNQWDPWGLFWMLSELPHGFGPDGHIAMAEAA